MYEVAVFSIVTVLCDHRDDLISENSHRAQKQPHTHQQSALGTPAPTPWRPPIYFLSIDLSILDSSCQWNLTTRALCVWLVTHRRLQLRPRCGTCRYFLPANGQTVLHAMKALAFLCPLTGCWMSGLVPTFRLPRTAPMCVYVHPRTVFCVDTDTRFSIPEGHAVLTPHYPVLLSAVSHPQDTLFLRPGL